MKKNQKLKLKKTNKTRHKWNRLSKFRNYKNYYYFQCDLCKIYKAIPKDIQSRQFFSIDGEFYLSEDMLENPKCGDVIIKSIL